MVVAGRVPNARLFSRVQLERARLHGRPGRRARCPGCLFFCHSSPLSSSPAYAFLPFGHRLPEEMSSSMRTKPALRSWRPVSTPRLRPPMAPLPSQPEHPAYRHALPRDWSPGVHGQAHYAQAQGQPHLRVLRDCPAQRLILLSPSPLSHAAAAGQHTQEERSRPCPSGCAYVQRISITASTHHTLGSSLRTRVRKAKLLTVYHHHHHHHTTRCSGAARVPSIYPESI